MAREFVNSGKSLVRGKKRVLASKDWPNEGVSEGLGGTWLNTKDAVAHGEKDLKGWSL